jgi:hypothetical protein
VTINERIEAGRRERRVLARVSRAGLRLEQAGRERTWALASARAEGISIRTLAAAAGLSPSRVHQIVADADLDALDAVLGELRAAGWPAPEDPGSGEDTELGHHCHLVRPEPLHRRLRLAGRLLIRPGARAGHHRRPPSPARKTPLADHARPGEPSRAPIAQIEHDVARASGTLPPTDPGRELEIRPTEQIGYLALLRSLFRHYLSRSVLSAALRITQSFLCNAIFFTYRLVLTFFFHVKPTDTAYYVMAFAAGNLADPLTLGRLFDTIGRKIMISGTYITSGGLLVITAQLFKAGVLTATTQTLCWSVIFFFASAGASAGYLTVSEVFPLEVRAQAIAVFFAICPVLRLAWLAPVWPPDRHRHRPGQAVLRLPGLRGRHDPGRPGRGVLRRRRRGQVPGGHPRPLSVVAKPAETIFRAGVHGDPNLSAGT